jgi:glycosyltransferase involved in cell wall biosynthesis
MSATVQVVVPEGIDDPLRPSGGNTYDRRLCSALSRSGWSVRMVPLEGDRRELSAALEAIADGSSVLVDGLVGSAYPEVMVPASERLRVVVLMHLPIGTDAARDDARAREREVVSAAAAVVTTSEWSRRWLIEEYAADPALVHVVPPGVDPATPTVGTTEGGRLLCVGPVTPGKGHDLLVTALARLADLSWRCACVGSLTTEPDFATDLRARIREAGLADRIELAGPRTGRELDAAYADADLLVHASRIETYGMVVTEALARAVPVVAADVGGIRESLGVAPDGTVPGLLTAPGDDAELADALRRWLADPDLRRRLRAAARRRRTELADWSTTAEGVARVLEKVAG